MKNLRKTQLRTVMRLLAGAVLLVFGIWLVVSANLKSREKEWERSSVGIRETNGFDGNGLEDFSDARSKIVRSIAFALTNQPEGRLWYVNSQRALPDRVAAKLPEWTPVPFFNRQRSMLQTLAAMGNAASNAIPSVLASLTNTVICYNGQPSRAYDPWVRSNALVTLGRIDEGLRLSRKTIEAQIRSGRWGNHGLVRDTADRVLTEHLPVKSED